MKANVHVLADGRRVDAVTLRKGAMTATVLTLGAIVQDLRLEGVDHPLVLGSPDPWAYLQDARYFGAIVGRFANRIGSAGFTIEGQEYRTDPNFEGRHTLHGGSDGTDIQVWDIIASSADNATLGLTLADGHMGFPGRIRMRVQIGLTDEALAIHLTAQSDRPTPCSLAHHGFFDLDGQGDIRGHHLAIAADRYLPLDADMIPTGRIAPVEGTVLDFRKPRQIGDHGYDHNFCLSDGSLPLRPVASLTGRNGLTMQVHTTACGLQLYDGSHIDLKAGLEGREYRPHSGVALETQGWPDAPNRPEFPDCILRPGQTYDQTTLYRFDRRGLGQASPIR